MSNKNALVFSTDVILYPILIVLSMWLVFWAEIRFHMDFTYLGIYPQRLSGLRGVLAGPFIHGSLQHLFNNSAPLLVLTTALFYFYRNIRWKVLIFGLLLTGLLTWLIGRPALHIGASGVVYMLVAFLFFKGVLSKRFQLIALSLVVVFLYGGLFWYVFPIDEKISWEGHLSGFAVGILFAFIFKSVPIENKKYAWEREDFNPDDDPFIQQFDEDGNFIETPSAHVPPEASAEAQEIIEEPPKMRVYYTLKKTDTDNKDSN